MFDSLKQKKRFTFLSILSFLNSANCMISKSRFGLFAIGLSSVLASPPIYFFPILLYGFPFAWFHACKQESFLEGCKKISYFLFGYFCGTFHWLGFPLLIDPRHWIFIPFAIAGSSLLLLLFALISFVPCLHVARITNSRIEQYILGAIALFLFEVIRSNFLFGGFPWQTVGVIFTITDYTMQIACIVHRCGLDLMASMIIFLPYLYFTKCYYRHMLFILCIIVLSIVTIFGFIRISGRNENEIFQIQKTQESQNVIDIVGIQGNVSQRMIYESASSVAVRAMVFDIYYRLFSSQYYNYNLEKGDIFVLPEGALTFYHENYNDGIIKKLSTLITRHKGLVIVPSVVAKVVNQKTGQTKYYNAVTAIDENGEIQHMYYKKHLVPFGEYTPFAKFLPLSWRESFGLGDMETGDQKHRTFINYKGLKIVPLICYDAIFDDSLYDDSGQKADLIINVSNDGWLGNSIGIYQHLAMVKLRAITANLPIFRIANNGISVLLNKNGVVMDYKKRNQVAILTSEVFISNKIDDGRVGNRFFK